MSLSNEQQAPDMITCFFCNHGSPDIAFAARVSLCKVIHTEGNQTMRNLAILLVGAVGGLQPGKRAFFHKHSVKVPRCEGCKIAHDAQIKHETGVSRRGKQQGAIMGSILGIGLALYIGTIHGFSWPVILAAPTSALVGAWLGSIISLWSMRGNGEHLPARVKPAGDKEKFPAIQKMMVDGWEIGQEPAPREGTEFVKVPRKRERETRTLERPFCKVCHAWLDECKCPHP